MLVSLTRFYFENFPLTHDGSALRLIFLKFGVMGDVYVVKRKNVKKLNFGFITIDGSIPAHDAVYRLNAISIGHIKMRTFKARYPPNKIDHREFQRIP